MFNRKATFQRKQKGEKILTRVAHVVGNSLQYINVDIADIHEDLPSPDAFSVSASLASGKNLQQVSSELEQSRNPLENVSEEVVLQNLENFEQSKD